MTVSTGLDSFSNPADIGVMYPFPGAEVLFVVVAVALWIAWHVSQVRQESREYAEAVEYYEGTGLEQAIFHGGSALMATEEELTTGEGRPETAGPPLQQD